VNPATANNLLLLTSTLLDLGLKIVQATALLQRTQAEGREPTDAEMLSMSGLDDAARARLQAAIDARTPV
jgi:hypothetical protein